MNPVYSRAANRIKILIEEGRKVASLESDSGVGPYIKEKIPLHTWLVKTENILNGVFGEGSIHYSRGKKIIDGGAEHAYEVNSLIGILTGALSDLEDGFLVGQEHLVAGVVLDSVLEQAKHLAENSYKDPAAVLGRVVVEDALRRISREESLADTGKASGLNDALRDKGRYTKPQWRVIQSWLDIGNSAAHGKFSDYDDSDVQTMIKDVERFLAQELGV